MTTTSPVHSNKTDAQRTAMVRTAAQWLPKRGLAAVNLVEVARSVQVPRGSIYHYFPGGRDQLLREALQLAAASGMRLIATASARSDTPQALVQGVFDASSRWLGLDFLGGCPIGAAALSMETENTQFTQDLHDCFAQWEHAIVLALRSKGVASDAHALAVAQSMLIAFEGAMVFAKGSRSSSAFDTAAHMVLAILDNPRIR